jgi:hypothetical protein
MRDMPLYSHGKRSMSGQSILRMPGVVHPQSHSLLIFSMDTRYQTLLLAGGTHKILHRLPNTLGTTATLGSRPANLQSTVWDIDVVQEKNTEGTAVEVKITSTSGYSGPGTFFFTIRRGWIKRFVIR